MKLTNISINNWIIISALLLSCNSEKEHCEIEDFEELKLYPVNTTLKIPPFKLVDSMKFDQQTILNYNVKTNDSSLTVVVFIYSYETDSTASFDINHRMGFQKQEVEFGQDSLKLLIETFKELGGVKVGYLKYFNEKKRRYESRIFFYRDRKLVVLWLFEKYQDDNKKESSLVDCIFENIKIGMY